MSHFDRFETLLEENPQLEERFEYCVMHDAFPQEPHRGPWSKEECVEWIREGEEDDGIKPGIFYLAVRLVGPWIKPRQ